MAEEIKETVRCLFEDKIAHISFGSSKANSLSSSSIASILEAFEKCAKNPELKVIVLRSEGEKTFCAGASFDEFKSLKTAAQAKEYFLGFAKIIQAIRKAKQFVLVRVQGTAVGGALGLIAAADYAIATDGALIRLSELELGIGPFVIEPALRIKMGLAAVSAMTIDAEWRDAAWAEAHGLYQKLCPNLHVLDEEVSQLAKKVASYEQQATLELKKVFSQDVDSLYKLMSERAEISGRLLIGKSLSSTPQ